MITIGGEIFDWVDGLAIVVGIFAIVCLYKLLRVR